MSSVNSFIYGTGGLVVFGLLLLLGVMFIAMDGFDLASGFILACGAGGLFDWLRKNKHIG